MLDRALLEDLVAQARLAPSVHNIQPTRWRADGSGLLVLEDTVRRLPVADPAGHDVRLSHGAAIEGLALALAEKGLRIAKIVTLDGQPEATGLRPVARLSFAAGASPDRLANPVAARVSWRGAFRRADADSRQALAHLAASNGDLRIVDQQIAVAAITTLGDRAGLHFLREEAHRREFLHWMRLSPAHPDYLRDGLNAEAMALGRLEAIGAGLVLGALFPLLDRLGLVGTLTSERGKTGSGALALFHRPAGEDALDTGRAFYRAWLAITATGLAACPVSVLADWPESRRTLEETHPLPTRRRLVNVFRLGLPVRAPANARARLPVSELIV
jgi:nitroreductase